MKTFKEYIEMASFSLPRKISIFGKEFNAIDMQFEKEPKTLDKNGHVMNQGSKFFAKLPDSNNYIVYDGKGYSQFSSPNKIDILLKLGFYEDPEDWYKKADFILDEAVVNFKNWLNLIEVGTMSSGVTGGIGDIAPFKMPIGIGMVRRTWPETITTEKKKKKKR